MLIFCCWASRNCCCCICCCCCCWNSACCCICGVNMLTAGLDIITLFCGGCCWDDGGCETTDCWGGDWTEIDCWMSCWEPRGDMGGVCVSEVTGKAESRRGSPTKPVAATAAGLPLDMVLVAESAVCWQPWDRRLMSSQQLYRPGRRQMPGW